METKVFKLTNDKNRREFIYNFKEWGLWYHDSNINADYYKCVLPNGKTIIAIQTPDIIETVYDSTYTTHHVQYHLIMPEKQYRVEANTIGEICGHLHELRGDIEVQCNFGEENHSWISVKDRLPSVGGTVLAYIKHNYVNDGFRAYRVYKYDGHFIGKGNLCEVTHWMPLPEPPKNL